MVSLGIFSIVAVVAAGSLLKIIDANKKAQSVKSVINNVSFALESMSRELRTGTLYYCSTDFDDIVSRSSLAGQDCSATPGTLLQFRAGDGRLIAYRYNPTNKSLEKAESSDATAQNLEAFIPVTSVRNVVLDNVSFIVKGAVANDTNPAKAFILISGYVAPKPHLRSDFTVQTTVAQRSRE